MCIRRSALFAVGLSALLPASIRGQEAPSRYGERDVVDGIAAIVGDSVILVTEIEDRILRLRAGGAQVPTDPEALDRLRQDVLRLFIDEQLILQAALADTTLQVDEERLEQVVADEMDQRLRSFSSPDEMREAMARQGLTPQTFREVIRNERRQQQLQEQFIAKHRGDARNIPVSEEELRSVFEAQRGQLANRPGTVSFRQVLVSPEPSDSAKLEALAEAERVLQMVRDGEDFEDLARRFSDDPGSRQLGGDLGWFRRGSMVAEFEDVVFALGEGRVSEVVETEFGYHIIKLDRVRGAERKARHILIQPEVTSADVDGARSLAEEVRRRAEAGEDFGALIDEFGNLEQATPPPVPMDQLDTALPPSYGPALRAASEGDIVGPLQMAGPRQANFGVVQVLEVRGQGEVGFEDVRSQLEQVLQQQKLVEQLISELRSKTYVEIRM